MKTATITHKLLGVSLFAALLVLATGCNEDFLQRDPYIGSSQGNFYQTAEDAEAAIKACYAPLQVEISAPGSHFRWFFGDVVSDDADKGGSGDADAADLQEFADFFGDPSSGMVLGEWQAAYKGITYCNIALENIPGIDMDELEKNALMAEARFIRAFWYFNLVTTFGGVPLVTTTLAPSEYAQPRASRQDVWDQIEADLIEASTYLREKSSFSQNETGRATSGAANALLAKAYLYQGKYAECRERCLEVIQSGEYSLAIDYGSIFTESGENGEGSIWEIQYANDSGGNWGAQFWSEGTYTNVFQRARGAFQGYGFNLPTQDFVDAFRTWTEVVNGNEIPRVDARLGYTVYTVGDTIADWGVLSEESTDMPHPYYARKYFNPASELAPFGDPNPNGGSNDRVIRYADVLLMHSESCNRLGFDDEAKESLKMVWERAGLPWKTNSIPGFDERYPDITPVWNHVGDQLLETIWRERRVELGLEGHRFFDLVRQGRAGEVLAEAGFQTDKSELFPIPTAEITLSNGQLTQNPGY